MLILQDPEDRGGKVPPQILGESLMLSLPILASFFDFSDLTSSVNESDWIKTMACLHVL